MGLMTRFKLSRKEAEEQLLRPLEGDPAEGEIAVVMALEKGKPADARQHLRNDPGIKDDLRELVETHLQSVQDGRNKAWTVRIPPEGYDIYRKQAERANCSLAGVLEDALRRDIEDHGSTVNLRETLKRDVARFNRVLDGTTKEIDAVLQRLGSVHELNMRVGRLEKAVQFAVKER